MKATDLRDMAEKELKEELEGLKKEQLNLRFQAATDQLEDTARVRAVRRNIARIKTILTERAAQSEANA